MSQPQELYVHLVIMTTLCSRKYLSQIWLSDTQSESPEFQQTFFYSLLPKHVHFWSFCKVSWSPFCYSGHLERLCLQYSFSTNFVQLGIVNFLCLIIPARRELLESRGLDFTDVWIAPNIRHQESWILFMFALTILDIPQCLSVIILDIPPCLSPRISHVLHHPWISKNNSSWLGLGQVFWPFQSCRHWILVQEAILAVGFLDDFLEKHTLQSDFQSKIQQSHTFKKLGAKNT